MSCRCAPPAGGCRAVSVSSEVDLSRNHLTELLDFFGHGSYSQAHTAPTGRQVGCEGATAGYAGERRKERGWAAEPRFSGSSPREGVASNGERPRSRSRGRSRFVGANLPVSPRLPLPSRSPQLEPETAAHGRVNRPSALTLWLGVIPFGRRDAITARAPGLSLLADSRRSLPSSSPGASTRRRAGFGSGRTLRRRPSCRRVDDDVAAQRPRTAAYGSIDSAAGCSPPVTAPLDGP